MNWLYTVNYILKQNYKNVINIKLKKIYRV